MFGEFRLLLVTRSPIQCYSIARALSALNVSDFQKLCSRLGETEVSQGGILQVRSRLHKCINDFLLQLARDLQYKVHGRCSLADVLDFAGKIQDMASSRDTSSEQHVVQQSMQARPA